MVPISSWNESYGCPKRIRHPRTEENPRSWNKIQEQRILKVADTNWIVTAKVVKEWRSEIVDDDDVLS